MYDMAKIGNLKTMAGAAPEAMAAFHAFDAAAFKEGALLGKVTELMRHALAVTPQCPYCIEIHTKKARTAGANDAEITEAVLVSAAIRAGGSVVHGTHAIK